MPAAGGGLEGGQQVQQAAASASPRAAQSFHRRTQEQTDVEAAPAWQAWAQGSSGQAHGSSLTGSGWASMARSSLGGCPKGPVQGHSPGQGGTRDGLTDGQGRHPGWVQPVSGAGEVARGSSEVPRGPTLVSAPRCDQPEPHGCPEPQNRITEPSLLRGAKAQVTQQVRDVAAISLATPLPGGRQRLGGNGMDRSAWTRNRDIKPPHPGA